MSNGMLWVRGPLIGRITRSVFKDLAIWMIGFGLTVGLIFPWAVHQMGVPKAYILTVPFHLYCLIAGFAVGGANVLLAHGVVRLRLRLLAERLTHITEILEKLQENREGVECKPEQCHLPEDSEDEIGATSRSFNLLVDTLDSALQTNRAVQTLTEVLVAQQSLAELAARALQEVRFWSGSSGGAILTAQEGELRLLAAHGLVEPERLARHPVVRLAYERQIEELLECPPDLPLDGVLAHFAPRAVVVLPICYQGASLGVLVVAANRAYLPEQVRRLRLFAKPLALALHNAMSFDHLERLAALDALTGCYNRRFGLERLREEYERAVRHETPLGVIIFDVDHFKSVNDTYGHLLGDRVLVRVARAARSVLRHGDVLVRYGGEEFLAVLPSANEADAAAVAERLRRAIEESPFMDEDHVIRITISAGVAAYPEAEVSSDRGLIECADLGVYTAKRAGRNRVVSHSQARACA